MVRLELFVAALCAAIVSGACAVDDARPLALVGPSPTPSSPACPVCTEATFAVVLPLPSPSPSPSPSPTATPSGAAPAYTAEADELEEALMLAAALVPSGRACLSSGGLLAPAGAVVQTEERAQLDVRCDCGGAP